MDFIDRHSRTIYRILHFLVSPIYRFFFWYKYTYLNRRFHVALSFKNNRPRLEITKHLDYLKQIDTELEKLLDEEDLPTFIYTALKKTKKCDAIVFKNPNETCKLVFTCNGLLNRLRLTCHTQEEEYQTKDFFAILGAFSHAGMRRMKENEVRAIDRSGLYDAAKHEENYMVQAIFGWEYVQATILVYELFTTVFNTQEDEIKCNAATHLPDTPPILIKLHHFIESFKKRAEQAEKN